MEVRSAVEMTVEFETLQQMIAVFGNLDENIRYIEENTRTTIIARDGAAVIKGEIDDMSVAKKVLEDLKRVFEAGDYIDINKISYFLEVTKEAPEKESSGDFLSLANVIALTHSGKPVKCRTFGQKKYMELIDKNTVVFAIGPAGTGKTYLAMAKAVVALKNKEVSRIILTRPAVEAGEKLGFLPGDLQSKVDPYLRPLYDALYEFMGPDAYQRMSENGTIEVAPLAYMRGRTLADAFIILDEAQNCSREQLKMFLTRFGDGSKVIVTGDITQIDLPEEKRSGLSRTAEILKGIDGIGVIELTQRDVVRHRLVKEIIKAFDKFEEKRK